MKFDRDTPPPPRLDASIILTSIFLAIVIFSTVAIFAVAHDDEH